MSDTRRASADAPGHWASAAVAFVLKHSKAGIVPLCTNVAMLMEQQHRLAQENENLSHELQVYKATFALPSDDEEVAISRWSQQNDAEPQRTGRPLAPASNSEVVPLNEMKPPDITLPSHLKRKIKGTIDKLKVLQQLHQFGKTWVPLDGCLCEACNSFQGTKASTKALTFNLLDKGHTAVIRRKLLGKICYVGHLDTSAPHWIWVGLELPGPVGFCDGRLGEKMYFKCKPLHGAFFNVTSVTAIIAESSKQVNLNERST